MNRVFARLGNRSRLWLVSVPTLALVCLIGAWAIRRPAVQASSTLEPSFSLPGGFYDRDIELRIKAPHLAGAVIFTVDGSAPTYSTGTPYSGPIRLSARTPGVTVVRARAVLPGGGLGPTVSASYFVGVQASLPMMSLIVDPSDLWDGERGIYVQATQTGDAWERPVDMTYVDRDRRSGFHVPAGIRVHGGVSRLYDKKSLRLYFRSEYGLSRLEYPLFGGSQAVGVNTHSFKRLVLHAGGQDGYTGSYVHWTLLRNALTDRLALQLGGCATRNQPVLLFINGQPWGIYQLRERIDRHFLADRYGIASADFLDTPDGSPGTPLMGDRENWDRLLQFVQAHDLADPAHYAYVQSQVDIANLLDYHILQIYAANTDWPHKNVYQFRPRAPGGRWRWMFWDSDRSYGAYPAYSYGGVDADFVQRVLGSETGESRAPLFQKLMDNPAFVQRFLARSADLLNTVLAPESVIPLIDDLAAELEPDIAHETTRWASAARWESSVQDLHDFAQHRADHVRQHIVERLGLQGTTQLLLNPPNSGRGTVAIDSTPLQKLPWQGIYFRGIPVQVMAVPAPGYRFAGWDPPELPQTPTITLTLHATQALTPRFEALGGDAPQPGDVVFGGYGTNGQNLTRGDWFTLRIMRRSGLDVRSWRVTDNDTKTATDEGSLVFAHHPAFARVPRGTTIAVRIVEVGPLPPDDLDAWDRRMTLYVGNGHLDASADPGFRLGLDDNLALLAPGATEAFEDDRGVAFVTADAAVTAASFGVLVDGVYATEPGSSAGR